METKEPGVEKEPKVGEREVLCKLKSIWCPACECDTEDCEADNYACEGLSNTIALIESSRESAKREERERIEKIIKEQVRLTPVILACGTCINAGEWRDILISKIGGGE